MSPMALLLLVFSCFITTSCLFGVITCYVNHEFHLIASTHITISGLFVVGIIYLVEISNMTFTVLLRYGVINISFLCFYLTYSISYLMLKGTTPLPPVKGDTMLEGKDSDSLRFDSFIFSCRSI